MGHQATVDVICSQIGDHNIWNMKRLMTNWYVSIYSKFYPIEKVILFLYKAVTEKKEMDPKYLNANTPQLICHCQHE